MRWLLVFAIACSKPPLTAPKASWPDLQPLAGAWTPTSNFMTDDSRLFHVGIAALWTH